MRATCTEGSICGVGGGVGSAPGHPIVTDHRQCVRGSATEPCGVIIVAAILAIWALGLLSLAFTLPLEFISPPDPDDHATEKGA